MRLDLLSEMNRARRERRATALVTDLESGDATLHSEGSEGSELGQHLARAFRTGQSGSVEADGRKLFVNVQVPPPKLVVIGAVHITQALAPMARIAGYDMEIIDPRTAFATAERFPDVVLHADWPETVLKTRPLDAYTALAAVTHDPKIDDFALKAALDAGCFYVGALGSRKTHARRVERLTALGASEDRIATIRAPIGLDISASSPAEIAVAVLAQVIAAFRKRGLAGPGGGRVTFGPVPVGEAVGVVLAHATQAGSRRIKKGTVLGPDDIAALRAAGVETIVAVRPAPGDVGEDLAASRIACGLEIAGASLRDASTGRVNIHADAAGILRVSRRLIDRINGVDPAVTIATLADFARVDRDQMVATIKIIPFAVSATLVAQIEDLTAAEQALSVAPFRPRRVGLVQTVLDSVKPSVMDKTARITGDRLARSGSRIETELRTAHEAETLAQAIGRLLPDSDLILVFGASALCDFDDVIPDAIRRSGGAVERVGMPVDPGNLLVLGRIGETPIIGAPGCARSPKENGFDWVLDRLSAGLEVSNADIAGMGVGGLLMEIPTRPQPREAPRKAPRPTVHAIVLAAGRSSRMGGPNKLLARFDGVPLVRRTAETVRCSTVAGITVVTGHQAEEIGAALAGLSVETAHNPDYANGLSTSVRVGLSRVPQEAAGILVMLADMPRIGSGDIDRLVSAFVAGGCERIVRATHAGKRGNPVILPRRLFGAVATLEGDTGARAIVESAGEQVVDVELGAAASLDVDTPEALREAGGVVTAQA